MKKEELSISQKVDLGIGKILFLGNQINRKTDACCFIDDSGHVCSLKLRIHKTKKNYNSTPIVYELDYEVSERYSWKKDSEERLYRINRCVEFLENTLKEKKIDYSIIYAVEEYIVTSYEI